MIKALLLFISKFFLYISIAGGILFLLFYFGFTDIDKVLKKTLALRGLEAISIDDTRRIFDVTPKKKWWPTFIRTKYGAHGAHHLQDGHFDHFRERTNIACCCLYCAVCKATRIF